MACLALALGAPVLAQTSARQRAHSTTLHRNVAQGYLGVGVADLTEDRARVLKLKNDSGVEVVLVADGSPAAKTGIKEHDVILAVNGKDVEDIEQFHGMIGDTAPGTKIKLAIWRNGMKQELSPALDSRPEVLNAFGGPELPDPPMPPMPDVPYNGGTPFPNIPATSPIVGFEGESLTAQLAEYFGVKDGVLVRSVTAKTPAERAGLKAGDVVIKVNGTPVMSPREISSLVRASHKKGLTFTVVRNKKQTTLNVELAEDISARAAKEAL